MNEQDYNNLRETSWQRKLSPAEEAQVQAWLAAHPEAREDWETDGGLNALLSDLPEAPRVSSNFTALVLQATRADAAARERAGGPGSLWRVLRHWVPRAATALVVVTSILVVQHQREVSHRATVAQNVAELTRAVSAPGPEVMQDFESIRRLDDSQTKADTELLALMK